MKLVVGGAILVAMLTSAHPAELRYDARLEQAAMDMIAKRIGDIRPGLNFKHVMDDGSVRPPRERVIANEPWNTATPRRKLRSSTVGSIQTFFGNGASASPTRSSGAGRHDRNLPHVMKF